MSQFQRGQYREQFLPEIDHRLAVWQAYLNCVNFTQRPMVETTSMQGVMQSSSQVDIEQFVYALGVLDGQIDDDKDEEFNNAGYKSIPELLEAKFPDKTAYEATIFRYWTRVDKLMRRKGFYTTSKLPSGHL